ncbi:MAG: ribose 5-phosphate isomerase B [Oscillospiraceae bacterium]
MIAIGSDHGGYELKKEIIKYFESNGIDYKDYGCYEPTSCDYPDIAKVTCEAVVAKEAEKAILICGTGVGISIAANKIKGIRAACCSDYFSAKYTRLHNDANALCMGGRVIGPGAAVELVKVFLSTEFEGGRHERRVEKITKLDNRGE